MVVLDRVIHMIPSDERRLDLLAKVRRWVRQSGYVLVADTRSNRYLIRESFSVQKWRRRVQ